MRSHLFGWEPTPGLLAFDLHDGGRSIRRHRAADGGRTWDTVPFTPFILVADPERLRHLGELLSLTRLAGDGELRWLARFGAWPAALAARDRYRPPDVPASPETAHWFPADPIQQYLLLGGNVSFGDLRFSDLRRLALDIEVLTTEGFDFPNAARAGDRVIAVALADSTGFRHVIRGDHLEEPELIAACTRLIRELDPDVIEGHNIFRFDLEYLEARARRHGIVLAWGRDGSALRGRLSRLSIAERTIGYRRYAVAGRHIVDTWILAQLHDAGARDLPSFGLKDLARHFGVAAADRTYVDGADIARLYREAPDRLMAYAGDDAVETLELSRILSPPYFTQAQIVPFDYQATALRGAAAKIDALLLREYLRQGRAVPLPRPVGAVGGGHTAIFLQGVARPVLHVDVTSLYPSIMLAHHILPTTDTLGVFPALLGELREFRVGAKRRLREATDPEEGAHLLALQQSFKILINAFYGYLAFGSGHWNDVDAANRVTTEGRRIVIEILDRLRALEASPIEVDTDGVYFVPPPGHAVGEDDALLARIAAGLPEWVQLDLAGRYDAMLSYKMKTYALLDGQDRIVLKGSAFRSRGLEPFQRLLIEEIVGLLLRGRRKEVQATRDRWLDDFASHRVPLRFFARTETLQESLEGYGEKVRAGSRNPSAAYELALASGRTFQPGDQVAYYVAGRGPAVSVTEAARPASTWDARRPDENVEYYRVKVADIWERFRSFTEQDGPRPYVDEDAAADRQLSLF